MSFTRELLSGGNVGNIGLKQLSEQREVISNRWDSLGLLEGLKGYDKENMAVLLENQASYLINENTTSDSSGSFETVAFPVIRRIFSKLLANEIVSVQALSLPVGRIYFYNPKISQRVNNAHTSIDGAFSNSASNYSLDADGRRVAKTGGTTFESYSLYDGFYATENNEYGDALFDRTSGKIFVKNVTLSGASFTNGTTKQYTVYLTGFSTTNAGKLVGPIGVPLDTEEFLSSLKVTSNVAFVGSSTSVYDIAAGKEIVFNIAAQQYAKGIVDSTGKLKLILDLTYPGAADGSYIALSGATTGTPVFTASYSVYSDTEDDSEMAEVSFDLEHTTVDVGMPKKLRATFTPEIAQDAAAFHSFNVESELVSLMSETVGHEIDRTILKDLRAGAAWIARWDYNGFAKRTGITRQDYNQELLIKINQVSAQIQKSTLRGGATWIVVSSEIGAIFNALEYFHVTDADPESLKYSMGIEKIGSLQNRYSVFVDMYAPANTILLGHKGDGIFNTGYIYAPYTPIMMLPAMRDPKTGKSIHILMSRFATKMINNKFYGKIFVDGVVTFGNGSDFR
jgi:hypothetical protein